MVRNALLAIVAGLAMLASQSVVADTGDTYSYDTIYDKIQDMQAKLQPLDDLRPVLKLSSSSCGTKLSDLTLELRSSHTVPEKLSIDKLGRVALPVEPKLYKSGYSLVSNQTHGLTYDVKMGLTVNSLSIPYSGLVQLEADFRQGLRSVGGFIAYHVMVPQGLVFIYADGSPSAVISSRKGDRTIVAQPADGYHGLPVGVSIIRLPLDQDSDHVDEKLTLQRPPDSVDVMFAPDIEQHVAEQDASDAGNCKSK